MDVVSEMEIRVTKLDASPVARMFDENVRLILFDDILVGYSPNPSLSVILPPYAANRMVGQLYDYCAHDKRRIAMLPLSRMYARKGKEGIDYFRLDIQRSVVASIWFIVYSAPAHHQATLESLLNRDIGNHNIGARLTVCLTTAQYGGNAGNRLALWPSIICEHLSDGGLGLVTTIISPDDVIRWIARTVIPITQLTTSWFAGIDNNFQGGKSILDTILPTPTRMHGPGQGQGSPLNWNRYLPVTNHILLHCCCYVMHE
jgi:hypothetical protein